MQATFADFILFHARSRPGKPAILWWIAWRPTACWRKACCGSRIGCAPLLSRRAGSSASPSAAPSAFDRRGGAVPSRSAGLVGHARQRDRPPRPADQAIPARRRRTNDSPDCARSLLATNPIVGEESCRFAATAGVGWSTKTRFAGWTFPPGRPADRRRPRRLSAPSINA